MLLQTRDIVIKSVKIKVANSRSVEKSWWVRLNEDSQKNIKELKGKL